uniref:Large ribosomal subunit protein uL23c n=1 Tax=Yamagishiella unicocca TaxID=51707 RepID=A0A385KPM2_9CHLO|nr:ribosomal protein L23 [Yamagishiella unicocca]AXZ97288.1 ribosomal protein L23 [Yamagishiella unicocca]
MTNMQTNWQEILTTSPSAVNKMVDLVKYPVITQKTYIALFKNRQYTFDVDLRLTKPQIKKVFETLFNVNVISVNTHIPPRQKIRVGLAQGFRPRYKRAIITLKEGQSINYSYKNEN